MTSWKLECAEDIPQQDNGSDCGMFICKFAEYISRLVELLEVKALDCFFTGEQGLLSARGT